MLWSTETDITVQSFLNLDLTMVFFIIDIHLEIFLPRSFSVFLDIPAVRIFLNQVSVINRHGTIVFEPGMV